jgi:hypothetical protein
VRLRDWEREALTILAEECVEVAHACSKALRHGLDSDNRGRLPHGNRQQIAMELEQVLFSAWVCVKLGMVQAPRYIPEPDAERAKNFHHLGFVGTGGDGGPDPSHYWMPMNWEVFAKKEGDR